VQLKSINYFTNELLRFRLTISLHNIKRRNIAWNNNSAINSREFIFSYENESNSGHPKFPPSIKPVVWPHFEPEKMQLPTLNSVLRSILILSSHLYLDYPSGHSPSDFLA
jgi:hypothetical protein